MDRIAQTHLLRLAHSLDRQPVLQAVTRHIAETGSIYVGDGKLLVCGSLLMPHVPSLENHKFQLSLGIRNSLAGKTWRMMVRCDEQSLDINMFSVMRDELINAAHPQSFYFITKYMTDLFNA